MVDASRYVTDSGGIKAGALGTTIAGTLYLAWVEGLIRTITRWGGGVTSSITSVGTWSQDVIWLLFLPMELSLGFDSAAAFVQQFGLLGQVAAGVYVVVLAVVLLKFLAWLVGVLSSAAGGD